jgi:hypothetical protein
LLKPYLFSKNPLQLNKGAGSGHKQGKEAYKTGGPTRQAGLQGRRASLNNVPANIFAATNNTTNEQLISQCNETYWLVLKNSLPSLLFHVTA